MGKLKVSAIVPAYNEEETVGEVVALLIKSPLVNEIICINDGSTDKTYSILKSFGKKINLVSYKKNRGKGFALSKGIKKANGDLVMFIDSDLKNLSLDHIRYLLKPMKNKKYKSVLGIALGKRKTSISNINAYLDRFITGERVYYKNQLLPYLSKMAKTGYGVEIFLNSLFKKNEKEVIFLRGLISPSKKSKGSMKRAIKSYVDASTDITQELGKQIIKKQYRKIRRLTLVNSFVDSLK